MKNVFRACLLLMISAAFCSCDNAGGTDGIGWGRIELMNSFYHQAPPGQEALLLSAFFVEAELTAQDDESFQTQLETPNGVKCDVSLHEGTESLNEIDATQLDGGEIRAGTEDEYLSITFAEGEYAKDVQILESASSNFPQWMNEPDTEVFISGLGNEHLDAFNLPIRFGTLPEPVSPPTPNSDVTQNSEGNYEITWSNAEEPDFQEVNFYFNVQMGNNLRPHFRCYPDSQTNTILFPGEWISTWSSMNIPEIWIDSINEETVEVNGTKIVGLSTSRIYTSCTMVE